MRLSFGARGADVAKICTRYSIVGRVVGLVGGVAVVACLVVVVFLVGFCCVVCRLLFFAEGGSGCVGATTASMGIG